MLTIALIALALALVAGALWLWHEARTVARPEYADYNARMDAADRSLDGVEAAPALTARRSPTRGERPDILAA
jgi:hypothetical protein